MTAASDWLAETVKRLEGWPRQSVMLIARVEHLRGLLAERTQDAANAARYQWLASRMCVTTDSDGSVVHWRLEWLWLGTVPRDACTPTPSVDEVIDELMRKVPPLPEAPT